MNDAIRITGNFAGITRGEMILLSDSVSKAGAITVGTAKDIVTQIVASGRYGSENIVGLAKAVENYSHITGESIDQVTPKLIKQFESPSKAAEEYNKQYHTLSVTELERIRTLDSTGKAQEALTEALKVIPNITPEYIRNVGLMEYAWIKVKKSFSEAQQAMKGTFSQLSPEEQIAKSTAEIDKITARYKTLSSTFDVEKDPRVIAAREEIRLAEIAKAASVQVAGYQKEAADEVNRQTKGQEMVHKNLQYQNKELRDQLVFAQGFTVIDGVRSYNIKDQTERTQTISKLNKEISDNERSQYATTKAMIDGRIAGEEKLLDLNTKAGIARIETEFKLGQLTQIEADKRKGALSLEANYTKQMFTQQELKNPTLSPEAKQALEYKLEQQVVEFKILEAQIGQQETINAMNKSRKDANDILTATLAYENAEKDEAIKHNQQITTFYNTTEALIKEEEFKLSLIGKTTEQQTLLNASHRLELDYFQARRGLVGTDAEVLKSTHESAQRRLRVAVQANADAAKNVNQFWMTAAKDMQRSMSTFFFDVMTGNLASFRASFQSMLQHMLSDALAAKAMFALVGPDYMKSGNTTAVGGLIGQGIKFLGNMFGGFQGANDADLAMAGGGAFTVGGQGGTDSQMVKFKATPGERVMVSTPAQQSDSGGNQTVVNNFNWTVNALDARSVSQLLANPVTQRTIRGIVESGYNVNGATSGMAQGY